MKKIYKNRIHQFLIISAIMISGIISSVNVYAADGNNQPDVSSEKSSITQVSSKSPATVQYSSENKSGFATITSKYAQIWGTMNWTDQTPSASYYHKTLRYNQVLTIRNGSKYIRLVTSSGSLIGYLNINCVKTAAREQGAAIPENRYATVTSNRGNIYSDFEWHVGHKLSSYWHQTLKIKNIYYHNNNQVYYSMVTDSGKWVGYFNSKYVALSSNGQLGTAIKANKYVTISKNNYAVYSNLAWRKLTTSNARMHVTYRVIYEYHHSQGSIYYQLRNKNSTVIGYVNSKAVTQGNGAQGAHVSFSKSVTLTGSAAVWKNFNWQKATKQYGSLKGKQLKVHSYYHHLNGSTYYSIYTTSGDWVGYVNATGTKKYVSSKPMWLRPSEDKPYPNLKNYPNAYFSVSQEKQRVYIKAANGKTLYTMICSTGLGHNTPNGWYKIQAERGLAFSGANYWTSWLNHGQYLFHTVIVNHDRSYNVAAAQKLGHKASHGCIRLPVPDAIWIYKNAPVGMRVHIY